MRAKKKIVRLRHQQPLMSNAEIGRKVGVSRSYVADILKKNDLVTNVPHQLYIKHCAICGNVMNKRRPSLTCSQHCRFLYNRIKVECAYCTVEFYLRRSEVVQRYKRGYRNIHCSRLCYNRSRRDV
jgi:predicted nucleic acid-binding Zn ribbon protein